MPLWEKQWFYSLLIYNLCLLNLSYYCCAFTFWDVKKALQNTSDLAFTWMNFILWHQCATFSFDPYSGLFRLKLERLYWYSPTANTWEQYYCPGIILRDHLPEVWDGVLSWDLSGDEVLGAVVASNPTCIDVIII
jgi:hypothetical protein